MIERHVVVLVFVCVDEKVDGGRLVNVMLIFQAVYLGLDVLSEVDGAEVVSARKLNTVFNTVRNPTHRLLARLEALVPDDTVDVIVLDSFHGMERGEVLVLLKPTAEQLGTLA